MASRATVGCDLGFEVFGKGSPSPKEASSDFGKVAKTVGGDASAVITSHPEGFEWNSLLSYVFGGSGRMIVAVLIPQLLRGDETVFKDMVDNGFGSPVGYGCDQLKQFFGEFRGCHPAPKD